MRAHTHFMAFIVPYLVLLYVSGCAYPLRYALNKDEITQSTQSIPLNVRAARLADSRDAVERRKEAREKLGQTDLSDYTYDSDFHGQVASKITRMMVDHLNFSGAFSSAVTIAPIRSEALSDAVLDSLQTAGIDGVLAGEVQHFYGYYDQNIGRKLLYAVPLGVASGFLLNWTFTTEEGKYEVYWYGPGLIAGYYLESLHSRQIERHTQLHVRLVSTSTHQSVWEEVFEVSSSGKNNMPGMNTEQRKFEVVIESLRDAVNQMVTRLSENSEAITQRKDQTDIQFPRPKKTAPKKQEVPRMVPLLKQRGFRFGLIGGLNLTSVSGHREGTSNLLTGFSAGARMSYRFSDRFAVRSELAYSTKGEKYAFTSASPFGAYTLVVDGDWKLSYIDLPVVSEFYPTENVKLFAGPSIGFFLDGSYSADARIEGPAPTTSSLSGDLTGDDVKSVDVGLLIGAGYSFGAVEIEARYSISLTDHAKTADEDLKHNVIQVIVGVNL